MLKGNPLCDQHSLESMLLRVLILSLACNYLSCWSFCMELSASLGPWLSYWICHRLYKWGLVFMVRNISSYAATVCTSVLFRGSWSNISHTVFVYVLSCSSSMHLLCNSWKISFLVVQHDSKLSAVYDSQGGIEPWSQWRRLTCVDESAMDLQSRNFLDMRASGSCDVDWFRLDISI